MNEKVESIKKIISFFIEIDPVNINVETIIDNSILQGSVKIHMMYGELADNGFKVSNYNNIKTFGELLNILNLNDGSNAAKVDSSSNSEMFSYSNDVNYNKNSNSEAINTQLALGVDIISVNTLPKVLDFRESNFYTDNFSLKEIAYCITKKDPYQSFAGKFAAKEAIVKADNNYKKFKFNEIEVLNDASGKPYFANFSISISHEAEIAIAIATLNTNISKTIAVTEHLTEDEIIHVPSVENKAPNTVVNNNKWLLLLLIINIIFMSYVLFFK